LVIFDRDYAIKTAGSNDEHLYPDPDGFVVDTPMGRYTGVREMIEMSKTPGEYQHPLTPLGCVATKLALIGVSPAQFGRNVKDFDETPAGPRERDVKRPLASQARCAVHIPDGIDRAMRCSETHRSDADVVTCAIDAGSPR
jgi:hypothetical protein